jgi:Flp pilus assembly pilin Flp
MLTYWRAHASGWRARRRFTDLAREEANMFRMMRQLAADESGMETVEWGVMAALIVGAVIAALTTLGTNVKRQFDIMVNATQ